MRKLIRPSREELDELRKRYSHTSITASKRMPRDHTGQEHRYLQAQTQLRAPMRVVMADGEEINGWIEYFDINFVRVTVHRGANRFIFKHDILYIQEESPPTRRRRAVQNY